MSQYIDKSTLVAEIERLEKINKEYKKTWKLKFKWFYRTIIGRLEVLEGLKAFLDTLEVKEVNLEKEIDRFYGMYRKDGKTFLLKDNKECVDWKIDCNPEFEKSFAKHFFELGRTVSNKAPKGMYE